MSLRKKLIKGGIWSVVTKFSTQYINLAVLIVLANFLGPEAFGTVAMVRVITNFMGYFTEFGLIASLIHKKEVDQTDCDTVFWSSVFISIILYALVYLGAPLVSAYYGIAELTLITRIIFIDFLIRPFYFVPSAFEVKKLKYNIISISNISAAIISAVVAITLALFKFGVWVLVIQQLCNTLVVVALILFFTRYKPGFKFSFTRLKELFSFGLHIMCNNLIKYFSENIDYLLVGTLLKEKILGIYMFSFRLSRYPIVQIWSLFGKMLFPAFASIKDNKERLQKNFLRISVAGAVVLIPPLLLIFFASEPLVKILGSKWQSHAKEMALIIKIFCGYLLFQASCYSDEPMLTALNKVYIVNIFKTVSSILLVVLGFIAIHYYNIKGMAWIYMATTLITSALIKIATTRILEIKLWAFIRSFGFVVVYFALSLIAALTCAHFRFSFYNDLIFVIALMIILTTVAGIILLAKKILLFKKPFLNVDHIIKFKL